MELSEIKELCKQFIEESKIDFLDISLWDCFKMPEDANHQDKTLLEHFSSLDWKNVKLTVAGQIRTGKNVQDVLNAGVDFVTIGRSAILHHNFPQLVMDNPDFVPISNPVSKDHLRNEGLGETFVKYMSNWPDFVADH